MSKESTVFSDKTSMGNGLFAISAGRVVTILHANGKDGGELRNLRSDRFMISVHEDRQFIGVLLIDGNSLLKVARAPRQTEPDAITIKTPMGEYIKQIGENGEIRIGAENQGLILTGEELDYMVSAVESLPE